MEQVEPSYTAEGGLMSGSLSQFLQVKTEDQLWHCVGAGHRQV